MINYFLILNLKKK